LHRYAIAQKITNDKIVLDIASGEGYGSFLISKNASRVYGVDIDEKSINYSSLKYSSSTNLQFMVGSTDKIPLEDSSVDVVVSFETIEHHDKHDLMIEEIKRVLKKDGFLLISSPEKNIYSERDPNNPYHLKELTFVEFKNLLENNFSNVSFFSQRFVIGSLIHLNDSETDMKFNMFDGDYSVIENHLCEDDFYNKAYFNLALCSNVNSTVALEVGTSLFNGVNVIKNEIVKKYTDILKSESFVLGNFIVKKINIIRRFWKKLSL
jgi:SAM-dependent methyltransferase